MYKSLIWKIFNVFLYKRKQQERSGSYLTDERSIYEERIFSKYVTTVFILTAIFFLILAYWIGNKPGIPFSGGQLFFPVFLMIFISVNFSTLKIKITFNGLSLRYGIMHYETTWDKVDSSFINYSRAGKLLPGWGITITSASQGGNRLNYRVPGKPEVICKMKEGLFEEVAFSSERPQIAITAVEQGVGR